MATVKKTADSKKRVTKPIPTPRIDKKTNSSNVVMIKPGSFLDRRGGMVPTVKLGKSASKKAI